MPVKVQKRGDVYRVIERDTGRLAKTGNGVARDGGGHDDKARAARQAAYINGALARKA